MLPTLVPIGALLAGIALLLLGSGLLNTVVSLRGSLEGFSDTTLLRRTVPSLLRAVKLVVWRTNGYLLGS